MDGVNVQNVLGQRVRKLRESKRMLQQEVAEALHISVSAYAKLESGVRGINSENCIALADLFGVSCDYILRGVEAENVDVCKRTGLTQQSINVLASHIHCEDEAYAEYKRHAENSAQAYKRYWDSVTSTVERFNAEYDGDIGDDDEEIEDEEIDDANYKKHKSEERKADRSKKRFRKYAISKHLLNEFITNNRLWEELRKAAYQYTISLEELWEIDNDSEEEPEYLEDMPFSAQYYHDRIAASRYLAGQAFANFFFDTFSDADFFRKVTEIPEKEITWKINAGLLSEKKEKE